VVECPVNVIVIYLYARGIDCAILKKRIKNKGYYASYDCDGDGKADLTINAHFSKCDEDPCGKIKGTVKHKCRKESAGAVVFETHVCSFVGYTRHHEDDECCKSLGDLLDR